MKNKKNLVEFLKETKRSVEKTHKLEAQKSLIKKP